MSVGREELKSCAFVQLQSGSIDKSWDVALIGSPGDKFNGKFLTANGEEYAIGNCGDNCHVLVNNN